MRVIFSFICLFLLAKPVVCIIHNYSQPQIIQTSVIALHAATCGATKVFIFALHHVFHVPTCSPALDSVSLSKNKISVPLDIPLEINNWNSKIQLDKKN